MLKQSWYKDEGYQPSLACNKVLLLLITHVPNGSNNPEFTRERKPAVKMEFILELRFAPSLSIRSIDRASTRGSLKMGAAM